MIAIFDCNFWLKMVWLWQWNGVYHVRIFVLFRISYITDLGLLKHFVAIWPTLKQSKIALMW